MNGIFISDRLKPCTCKVIKLTFNSLMKKSCSEKISENYKSRNIPLLFIENGQTDDMIGVVLSDNTKIVLFCKEVSQKSKEKKVRCVYVIPKKLLQYIHYESGKIIADSISELYDVDPELVSKYCSFYRNEEEIINPSSLDRLLIKINNEIIPDKISTLLEYVNKLGSTIGYYIPRESYPNIKLAFASKNSYTMDDELLEYDELMDDEDNVDTIVKKICSSKKPYVEELLLIKAKNSQNCAIEVSKIIVECLFPLLFNDNNF